MHFKGWDNVHIMRICHQFTYGANAKVGCFPQKYRISNITSTCSEEVFRFWWHQNLEKRSDVRHEMFIYMQPSVFVALV